MRWLSKLALPLSAVAVVLTVLSLSWWEWREARTLRKETEHHAELDRQLAAVARQSEAKTKATQQLLAGGLTLLETAALFRHIDKDTPDCPEQNWRAFKGCCPEEKVCRQVISWAHHHAPD